MPIAITLTDKFTAPEILNLTTPSALDVPTFLNVHITSSPVVEPVLFIIVAVTTGVNLNSGYVKKNDSVVFPDAFVVLKVLVAENIFKLLVVSVFSLTFDVEVDLIAIVLAIELI
jgi:hypothetical protein